MEVTQAKFARMAGVSRASISGKVKNKTLILNSGGMLDTDNPVNREYLDMHGEKRKQAQNNLAAASSVLSGVEKKSVKTPLVENFSENHPQRGYTMTDSAAATAAGIPEYMLGLTIRELIVQHGTIQGIERYVKILRDLTAADEKDQRMQERRMLQIPKEFVTSHIFELLEQMTNKMFDLPERIVDNLIALVVADAAAARQQIINNLRDNISIVISDTKEIMIKQLESLKNKYDDTLSDNLQDLKEQVSELVENGGA